MKNIIPLLIISLCAPATSIAQFAISPVLGANICKVKFTGDLSDSSPVLRYALGVQVSYEVSKKFSAGLMLQVATKGYGTTKDKQSLIGTEANFQYLEALPFVEYKPFVFLGFIAGGSVGYLTLEEYRISGSWSKSAFDIIEPLDISAFAGARFYHKNAFISLTFSHSVLPIWEINLTDDNGNTIENVQSYHQNLTLAIGYKLHLRKK